MGFSIDQVQATIVSCDIIGHGKEPEHSRQIVLIKELNDIVRESLQRFDHQEVVWASGGDGGHIAFLTDEGVVEAIALIQRLKEWADRQTIKLRVTVHTGLVSAIEGADGRPQLVGDGINLCGSLVTFGVPRSVVVTEAFRDHVNAMIRNGVPLPELEFRDERVVYLKHFAAHHLYLLSLADDPPETLLLERSDHKKIQEARDNDNLWQMIYYMKRMLQINSMDPDALRALNEIESGSLMYYPKSRPVIHPLLGVIPRPALLRLLQASELIEREDGDIICRRNDTGDSLFIVLKGEIGVVTKPQTDHADHSRPADIRIGEGGLVGELALALNRRRTATLQVLGPTALLTINYNALNALLKKESPRSSLRINFEKFLEERILEHICRHVPYLNLPHVDVEDALTPEFRDRLVDGAETFTIEPQQLRQLSFGDTVSLGEDGSIDLSRDGLYILASGELDEAFSSNRIHKKLRGEEFDILFASLPGEIVSIDRKYKLTPNKRITVIWISTIALAEYAQEKYRHIIRRIRRRLASQMLFDVFISYSRENEELASLWRDELQKAGLTIFMNTPERLKSFEPEIDFALAESRVLVPIISRAALKTEWVMREIDKRKKIFDENHANILPIETEFRLAEVMAVGFTPVVSGRRGSEEEQRSMASVIETIRAVRDGDAPLPYLLHRR